MLSLLSSVHDQANTTGLVSDTHVWVLPRYFNPNWWKTEGERTSNDSSECTDKEMEEILDSVIFVDSVKVPPIVSYS